MKIGQYLVKLWARVWCLVFLTHGVFYLKNAFLFLHWKWPARGTSTVPIVSAHFRSIYRLSIAGTRAAVSGSVMFRAEVRGTQTSAYFYFENKTPLLFHFRRLKVSTGCRRCRFHSHGPTPDALRRHSIVSLRRVRSDVNWS